MVTQFILQEKIKCFYQSLSPPETGSGEEERETPGDGSLLGLSAGSIVKYAGGSLLGGCSKRQGGVQAMLVF